MSESVRVAVVTPVYNGAAYLSECIESVLKQTYSDFEYVIVDNWSTDRSAEIVREYMDSDKRIRLFRPERHLPIIQNWNFSVSCMSESIEYCKMVHADDRLMPECLEKMLRLANEQPTVGIVGAYRLEETRPSLGGVDPSRAVIPGLEVGAAALEGRMSVFGSPTQLLIRTASMEREEPFFDESLLHADKDSCLRLLKRWDFGFVPEILTFTRRHNESKTSEVRLLETRRSEDLILLKRYGSHFLGARFHEVWKRRFAGYHRSLASGLLDGRGRKYWRYQRDGLRRIGESVNYMRLAWELLLHLANLTNLARRLAYRLRRSVQH